MTDHEQHCCRGGICEDRIASIEAEANRERVQHLNLYRLWRASEARAEAAEKQVFQVVVQRDNYANQLDKVVELLRVSLEKKQ